MLWIALHLPDLPVQVFCRADPDGTPLVVCGSGPSRAVLAANRAALGRGIEPGARLASALVLIPELIHRDRAPEAEASLLHELAGWAQQFTPEVCLDPPDALLLDVAASLRLFGGLEALRQRLTDGCAALGIEVSIACAPTPLAARWLARGACPIPQRQITDTAALPTALAPIPLHCVIDDAATVKFFSHLGCHTLGDCYALPRAGLAQRGKQNFLRQLDQAIGTLPDPRGAWQPPPEFQARLELPCAMERADALLFGCKRLFTALTGALAARHRAIEHFTLSFEHDEHAPTTLKIHLGEACRDEARFLLLTREHLTAHQLPAPAQAISLHAPHWLDAPHHNAALFPDITDPHQTRAVVIARLIARLGPDSVSQLDVRADHRPECSTGKIPPGPTRRPSTTSPARPLWLLDPPARIASGHQSPWHPRRLTPLSGPERIESGWWDSREVLRDYYIARDGQAALWWVFQDLLPPHDWFVHGLFS